MPAQIRPNRLEVTDRFPMLGFTIRTDGTPARAEVAIATEPALFKAENKPKRTTANFFSSRAYGPLDVPRGEAVYILPAEVLARFIGQQRLYVALATTPERNGGPHVDVLPTEGSPYILINGLTGRSLRRVRMVPSRQERAAGYGADSKGALEWLGDAPIPGSATPATNGNGTRVGGSGEPDYDDGFGPLTTAPSTATTPAAAPTSGATSPSAAPPVASSGNGTGATAGGTVAPSLTPAITPGAVVTAKALDVPPLTLAGDRRTVTPPSVQRLSRWETAAVEGAIAVLGGPLGPAIAALPLAARAANVSIGVGPAVGGGLGAGAGLGVGVVFGPDGGIGVYGAVEFQVGFLASISATAQITIVNGGIENFNGWGTAISISGGEAIVGGASALFDMNANFQGVSFQLGVGAGLTPIDFYVAVQRQIGAQVAVAQAAAARPYAAPRSANVFAAARAMSGEIPLDPGNGGLSIGPDSLEVGDIILSTTSAAVSDLIRFGTGSSVSHAMLYVGQGEQVVDATSAGVRLRPLADAISDATVAVAFRYPGLSDNQRAIIADRVAEYIGRPYNYWGIVRQAQFRMHSVVCDLLPDAQASACRTFYGQVDLGRGNSTEFFCSQLIVAAYQAGGVPITETPPIWSSPDDLAQLALRQGVLAYVGHLKAPPYTRRQSIWESLGLAATAQALSATPARSLTNESFTINWDEVQAVPQPTDVSCWAASGAMVVGWRDRMSLTPETIAQIASSTTATGLDPGQVQQFANDLGLVAEAAQSYTVDGFRQLLESSGPLWIAASVPGLHAIVVTGMYADGDNTYVRVTDPWDRQTGTPGAPGAYSNTHVTGSRYILKWQDFVREYEAAATDYSSVNLQILHAPSAAGRTPNRGSATSAGYAQALRAARTLTDESFTINWDEVEAVPQPTDFSCWAAAGAMVVGWRDRVSLSPDSLAQICARTTATGLDPAQIQQFANEIGLVPEPPQSYSVDGFRRLLENYGPLWVAASVPGLHAIVVTGMYADGPNVFVRVTDPWDRQAGTPGAPGAYRRTHATGSRYILKWDDFVREYESAATDYAQVNLQILHSDRAAGRSINRGSATSAGYAQALRNVRATQRAALAKGQGDDAAPSPGAPPAPVRRVESGSAGATSWSLEQYAGLRRAPGAPPVANGTPSERAVHLDDWPLVHLPEGDVQLPLTVAWRYSAGAIGDVAIRAGQPLSVDGWRLAVSTEIAEGPDAGALAAISVTIRYRFSSAGRSDIVAVTQLTVFGDGTYNRQDRWEQQAEAGAA